jgi:hypothetical protein
VLIIGSVHQKAAGAAAAHDEPAVID